MVGVDPGGELQGVHEPDDGREAERRRPSLREHPDGHEAVGEVACTAVVARPLPRSPWLEMLTVDDHVGAAAVPAGAPEGAAGGGTRGVEGFLAMCSGD